MRKFITKLMAVIGCMIWLCGCGEAEAQNTVSSVEEVRGAETEENLEEVPNTETEENEGEAMPEADTNMSYTEKCTSMLIEIPEADKLEKKEGTEYPEFEIYKYYSNTAERETNVNVLLPQGYSEDKEYPVLYILHGYWDNETWMARDVVKLSSMYTNLVADGEAEEMIIVCPYIYCSRDMEYCTAMDTENTLNYDNFINDMMTDLMPFIESTFSVAKGKENAAITGFSMGGRESLYIGFTYPDKFGYIGAVCPAPGVVNGTGIPYNLEKEEFVFGDEVPYLLMISASDSDGVVGNNPKTYHDMLDSSGIEHVWHVMSKTGHDASSVTPHLYNFLRMIFKAE